MDVAIVDGSEGVVGMVVRGGPMMRLAREKTSLNGLAASKEQDVESSDG